MTPFLIRPLIGAALVSALVVSSARSAENSVAAENSEVDDKAEIVLVVGAAGTPEFGKQFDQWANTWDSIAQKTGMKLTTIGRDEDAEQTDHDRLQAVLSKISSTRTTATWVIFIGHGTYSRQTAKFNLRGPDVSATELAQWIQPIQSPIVIVNCASSSGPFINRLSGANRIVVTATKSGTQYNFARFGKYFADAIASVDSDLDHDDEVSVQEAFLRASSSVNEFYDGQARIVTEHALIDDNGDSKGTPAKMFRGVRPIATAKDGSALDGKFAAKIALSASGKGLVLNPQERKQRDDLERQLDQLRQQKQTLESDEYQQAILPLLVKLAKIYQAVEARAGTNNETK